MKASSKKGRSRSARGAGAASEHVSGGGGAWTTRHWELRRDAGESDGGLQRRVLSLIGAPGGFQRDYTLRCSGGCLDDWASALSLAKRSRGYVTNMSPVHRPGCSCFAGRRSRTGHDGTRRGDLRRSTVVSHAGGGGARAAVRGAPPWELRWTPMMSASAFVCDEESKHLGRKSAFSAHGVEPGTKYNVEPRWEHGRIVYTSDFKPPQGNYVVAVEVIGKGPGVVAELGKRYATPEAAKASCARHAQVEGMRIYGDRYALRAAARAEEIARMRGAS